MQFKVKLSSLNRADVSKAPESSVKTGGKTEFIGEQGSETQADAVVFQDRQVVALLVLLVL